MMVLEKNVIYRNKSIGISCIIYMAYALFYMTGSNSELHNYIQFALFGLWNLFAFKEDPKSFRLAITSKPTIYLFLFLIYYFVTSIIEGELIYTLTYVGVYLMIYTCHVQFIYYYQRSRYKEIKFIVLTSLIGWSLIAIFAIAFYTINPAAARTLAADFTAYENLYIGGGYAIAFGSAIIFTYLTTLLFKRLGIINKILIAFVVFLLFYLIVKTESTTTLIASIIGAIVGLLYEIRTNISKGLKVVIYIASIAILVFLLNGGLVRVIYQISDSTTDELYARRFDRIGEKLLSFESGSSNENYVDERWGLVTESFNTFLENPLFGVGYKVGNKFSALEAIGVGTHSEMFDILAQFGLIGGFLFYAFFISSLKRVNKRIKNKSFLITLFIMALMNPFHYFHGFYALFVMMPFIDILMSTKLKENV